MDQYKKLTKDIFLCYISRVMIGFVFYMPLIAVVNDIISPSTKKEYGITNEDLNILKQIV